MHIKLNADASVIAAAGEKPKSIDNVEARSSSSSFLLYCLFSNAVLLVKMILLTLLLVSFNELLELIWLLSQEGEDPLGISFVCHWVFQWLLLSTVQTTRELRISTSFPWKGSRVVLIGYHPHVLVIWLWLLSRKASLISGRRSCLLLLLGSASHGAERMASSCISKVCLFSSFPYLVFRRCCLFLLRWMEEDLV